MFAKGERGGSMSENTFQEIMKKVKAVHSIANKKQKMYQKIDEFKKNFSALKDVNIIKAIREKKIGISFSFNEGESERRMLLGYQLLRELARDPECHWEHFGFNLREKIKGSLSVEFQPWDGDVSGQFLLRVCLCFLSIEELFKNREESHHNGIDVYTFSIVDLSELIPEFIVDGGVANASQE